MNYQSKIRTFERTRINYGRFMESTTWKLTGNRELFGEAYQHTMLMLWRHIEKFENQQSGGYLYRIILSSVSKAWRDTLGKEKHNIETPEHICSSEPEPSEQIIEKEALNNLRRMITKLPEQQGKAITMRYLESKCYSTLAEELHCSESAARAHVSHAITRLRGILDNNKEELSYE